MKVTVGMPVYNRPVELRRAIESILAQTYKDIEIVISNNCSPNTEVDLVIKEYMNADERIHYFYQDKPLRVIDNFRFVLANATGDYFVFLADDDWFDKDYIEKCVAFLQNNSDYSLACGSCSYHDEDAVLIDNENLVSITDNNTFNRVKYYYKHVRFNGYFYSLRKTELSKKIELRDKMAFDWLYLAALVYSGKVKVLEDTAMHITKGGMSTDVVEMNRNIGANTIISRNLIGLTIAYNAFEDIFQQKIYSMSAISKFIFSVKIFFAVYTKTFMWDVLFLKNKILRRKK